jgi:hypothetical protein
MRKVSRSILAPSGAAESSPAGTAGSATLKRTVPAGSADEHQFQPYLSGLRDMPQLTRQFLPGCFHSRLSALGARQAESETSNPVDPVEQATQLVKSSAFST